MKRTLTLLFGILVGLPALCQVLILPNDSVKVVFVDYDDPTKTQWLQPNREEVRSIKPGELYVPVFNILPSNETGYFLKTIAVPLPLILDSTAIDSAPGSGMAYSGTWMHMNNSTTQWYKNTASSTSQTNATATYSCEKCREFKWYTEKYPHNGIAAVSIDDGEETLIDLYHSTRLSKQLVFFRSFPEGKHKIRIRCTGTKNQRSTGYIVINDFLNELRKK